MSIVTSLTFNEFQENTFIVYDDTSEAIIIDPGCHTTNEESQLKSFISEKNLTVKMILNTHCHLDHVFGNAFAAQTYEVGVFIHKDELPLLKSYVQVANMYGLQANESPDPVGFLDPGNDIHFGKTVLEVRFTPGHSPASISFYCKEDGYIIGGDVLFYGSIGRTDLPGGNYNTLLESIKSQFLSLPDEVTVYSGHGPTTTIGQERATNPFLLSG